jgi:hypothetical protein
MKFNERSENFHSWCMLWLPPPLTTPGLAEAPAFFTMSLKEKPFEAQGSDLMSLGKAEDI